MRLEPYNKNRKFEKNEQFRDAHTTYQRVDSYCRLPHHKCQKNNDTVRFSEYLFTLTFTKTNADDECLFS